MNIFAGGFSGEPKTLQLRTAGFRPAARPDVMHHVHGFGFLAGLEKHAVPGGRALLLLSPEKDVGAEAVVGVRGDGDFIALAVHVRLDRAVVFNRRAPGGLADFPMSSGAPFGHHIWTVPTRGVKVARQVDDVRIHLNGEQVQVGGAGLVLIHQILVQAGERRGGGMIWIHLMNHFGNVIDGVPNLGVGGVQIQFIADVPHQQGGMILVFQNLGLDCRQLSGHGPGVGIIKPLPLAGNVQAHGDIQTVFISAVQDLLPGLAPVLRAPGAKGISPVRGQLFLVAVLESGALDIKPLMVDEELPAAVHPGHLHPGRTGLRAGFVRRAASASGKTSQQNRRPFEQNIFHKNQPAPRAAMIEATGRMDDPAGFIMWKICSILLPCRLIWLRPKASERGTATDF